MACFADAVALFTGPDLTGRMTVLDTPGSYRASSGKFPDGTIESVFVPVGWRAVLWDYDNFTGASETFRMLPGNLAARRSVGVQASSVVVTAGEHIGHAQVCVAGTMQANNPAVCVEIEQICSRSSQKKGDLFVLASWRSPVTAPLCCSP